MYYEFFCFRELEKEYFYSPIFDVTDTKTCDGQSKIDISKRAFSHTLKYKSSSILELDYRIKEISLITPYYIKGTVVSVFELYFKLTDNLVSRGYDIYKRHLDTLREAESLVLSGFSYQYEDYKRRVLLNYAVGFMKKEIERIINNK